MTIFSPPQVAERWKCKPETVRHLLEAGTLRGFTLSPPGTRDRVARHARRRACL